MNSSNTSSSALFCDSFKSFHGGYEKVNINCTKYRTYFGDQIVIIRKIVEGTLQVYELKVYRKFYNNEKTSCQVFGTICFLDPIKFVQRSKVDLFELGIHLIEQSSSSYHLILNLYCSCMYHLRETRLRRGTECNHFEVNQINYQFKFREEIHC